MVERTREIRRVLLVTLVLNEAVALVKILYGYAIASVGMVSDGFHSFFDGMSNVVGLLGIWIASHPPDRDHPYGHRKYETLFTIAVAIMIFGTCWQILKRVYLSFTQGVQPRVEPLSFLVMAATIGVNLWVMRYELRKGRALKSDFLVADALHTKSDVLASAAVLLGLASVRLGLPLGDALAGLLITVLIVKIGLQVLRQASAVLVDTMCIETTAIERVALAVPGVRGCHSIRTRGTQEHVYLDMSILVQPHITAQEAHEIAERLEAKLKEAFPALGDVLIHVEPEGETEGP